MGYDTRKQFVQCTPLWCAARMPMWRGQRTRNCPVGAQEWRTSGATREYILTHAIWLGNGQMTWHMTVIGSSYLENEGPKDQTALVAVTTATAQMADAD